MASAPPSPGRAYDLRDNLSCSTAEAHHQPIPSTRPTCWPDLPNLALRKRSRHTARTRYARAGCSEVPNTHGDSGRVAGYWCRPRSRARWDADVLPRIADKLAQVPQTRRLDIQAWQALGECVTSQLCGAARAMRKVLEFGPGHPYLPSQEIHANTGGDGNFESFIDSDPRTARELMAPAAGIGAAGSPITGRTWYHGHRAAGRRACALRPCKKAVDSPHIWGTWIRSRDLHQISSTGCQAPITTALIGYIWNPQQRPSIANPNPVRAIVIPAKTRPRACPACASNGRNGKSGRGAGGGG